MVRIRPVLFSRGGAVCPTIDQHDQVQQHAQIETTHCDLTGILDRGRAPVGPFAGNAEAAAFYLTQKQRVDTRDAARLQYWKALALERMKRMADLSPTQIRVGLLCSSR